MCSPHLGMSPTPLWPSLWLCCYSLCLHGSPSSTSPARLRKVMPLSWPRIHQGWGPGSKGSPWKSLGLGGRKAHTTKEDWQDCRVWAEGIFQALPGYCLVQNLFCFLNIWNHINITSGTEKCFEFPITPSVLFCFLSSYQFLLIYMYIIRLYSKHTIWILLLCCFCFQVFDCVIL